jgi:hypothetical protein
MPVDLTAAREALAEWDAMSEHDQEGGADFPDVDYLRAALARVAELEARNATLEHLEASQHKARARDVAAIVAWLRGTADKLTGNDYREYTLIADAIERGDWHDGVLPPDPRDERIKALEAEVASLRAVVGVNRG